MNYDVIQLLRHRFFSVITTKFTQYMQDIKIKQYHSLQLFRTLFRLLFIEKLKTYD